MSGSICDVRPSRASYRPLSETDLIVICSYRARKGGSKGAQCAWTPRLGNDPQPVGVPD